jgi:hypothetical protein
MGQCLYRHARWLAPVIRWLKRDFFARDLAFIQYLGAATSEREANTEILSFQDANLAKWSFCRTTLRIRVSGRKASKLAHAVFAGRKRS